MRGALPTRMAGRLEAPAIPFVNGGIDQVAHY
jgi:hypothetical protein